MTKTYAWMYERSQETFLYDNLFTCYLGVFDDFYSAKHLVYIGLLFRFLSCFFFFQPSYLLMNHLKDKFLANYRDYSIDSGIILIYGTQFCNIYCESLEIDV